MWTDKDMIEFARWFDYWKSHPDVGNTAEEAFNTYKKIVRKEKLKKLKK